MFFTILIVLGIFGTLSSGVPLESPSSDFTKFFSPRIVGGSVAANGRAPYMAALVVGDIWLAMTCGASIITSRHIVTAAHCFALDGHGNLLNTFRAIVGTNTWYRGTVVLLDSHKIHPEYDYWNIKNDIGILTTRDKIMMNDRVATIALNYDHVGGGEKSFVTGWGTTQLWGSTPDQLQILYLSTISSKECIRRLREVPGNPPHLEPAQEICTLHSPGRGLCHGDSGSALVSVASGKQSGIVSWAMRPCAFGAPDVYVRISSYKDFIQKHTELE